MPPATLFSSDPVTDWQRLRHEMTKAIVQLGRLGDIFSALPLALDFSLTQDTRLVIAEEFAGILEGCSYVGEELFPGKYPDLQEGIKWAEQKFPGNVSVTQVYEGPSKPAYRVDESFQRDAWHRAGVSDRWEQVPLIFDRRNHARENELVGKFEWTKPVVLYWGRAFTGAFTHADALLRALERLLPEFKLVDVTQHIWATRFYDLLGLFDRAHALVTVDTATLHLAAASSIPTVAMVNSVPWLASLRRPNHLIRRTYAELNPQEIAAAIRATNRPLTRLIHVYPLKNEMSAEAKRRHEISQASWQQEYLSGPWETCPIATERLPRNATEFGDDPMPFAKDLLRVAMERCREDNDLVVLTASDIGCAEGISEHLRRLVLAKGSAYSWRTNLTVAPQRPPNRYDVARGFFDRRISLFAFTFRWLKLHFDALPDILLGRALGEFVYRDFIKRTGGGELHNVIWHLAHGPTRKTDGPGDHYNAKISASWHQNVDTTRPYLHDYLQLPMVPVESWQNLTSERRSGSAGVPPAV